MGRFLHALILTLLWLFKPPGAGTPFSREIKLSPNFWLSEFVSKNDPDGWGYVERNWGWIEQELRFLCVHVLEPIRAHFGGPVRITSGARSWRWNTLIGGATFSQHPKGKAADFSIDGVSLASIHAFAGTLKAVGGLALGPGFVHVDSRRRLFGRITRWVY